MVGGGQGELLEAALGCERRRRRERLDQSHDVIGRPRGLPAPTSRPLRWVDVLPQGKATGRTHRARAGTARPRVGKSPKEVPSAAPGELLTQRGRKGAWPGGGLRTRGGAAPAAHPDPGATAPFPPRHRSVPAGVSPDSRAAGSPLPRPSGRGGGNRLPPGQTALLPELLLGSRTQHCSSPGRRIVDSLKR